MLGNHCLITTYEARLLNATPTPPLFTQTPFDMDMRQHSFSINSYLNRHTFDVRRDMQGFISIRNFDIRQGFLRLWDYILIVYVVPEK